MAKKKQNKPRGKGGWLAGRSATQIICVSFLLVIAAGTLLLTLPISSRNGRLGVLDAMFTATSATCVTGLVVRDTWTQFTVFGQVVLLVLIRKKSVSRKKGSARPDIKRAGAPAPAETPFAPLFSPESRSAPIKKEDQP